MVGPCAHGWGVEAGVGEKVILGIKTDVRFCLHRGHNNLYYCQVTMMTRVSSKNQFKSNSDSLISKVSALTIRYPPSNNREIAAHIEKCFLSPSSTNRRHLCQSCQVKNSLSSKCFTGLGVSIRITALAFRTNLEDNLLRLGSCQFSLAY